MILPTPAIYAITNTVTGKKYIGGASYPSQRFYEHKSALRAGKHRNKELQSDWDKYGFGCFSFDVIEETTKEKLSEREDFYINAQRDKYNKLNGHTGRTKGDLGYSGEEKDSNRRKDNPKRSAPLLTENRVAQNRASHLRRKAQKENAMTLNGWKNEDEVITYMINEANAGRIAFPNPNGGK